MSLSLAQRTAGILSQGAIEVGAGDFEQSISAQVRAKAMGLLRKRGRLALEEVQRLFQWERPRSMPNRLLAERLGITERQLSRLIRGDYLREKDRERRNAVRETGDLALVQHVSRNLQFTISLPTSWRVVVDTHEIARLAAEYREVVLRSDPPKKPSRPYGFGQAFAVGQAAGVADIRARLLAKAEHEARKADAERHARLEQMTIGLFQAGPLADEGEPVLEVTKLHMDRPLTALEIYELDKHLPEIVPWGNRPSKRLTVDGLSGVVYYFTMDTGERPLTRAICRAQPAFFNVYLAEGLEGWVLSCQSRCGEAYLKAFHKYKPLFRRIVGSFRRLRSSK